MIKMSSLPAEVVPFQSTRLKLKKKKKKKRKTPPLIDKENEKENLES